MSEYVIRNRGETSEFLAGLAAGSLNALFDGRGVHCQWTPAVERAIVFRNLEDAVALAVLCNGTAEPVPKDGRPSGTFLRSARSWPE